MQNAGNLLARSPVAKGVHGGAHALGPGLVGEGEVEQFAETFWVVAYQDGDAGFDGFGALGIATENEQWLAERWRFFLNAAGIGDEQPGVLEQVDKIWIIQRLDQMNAILPTQLGFCGGADVGIGMNGEDGGDIIMLADKVTERSQVLAHDFAKAFAAVRGEDDELFAGGELQEFGGSGRRLSVLQDELERIDDRISRDEDDGFGDAFGEQRGAVSFGGREMISGDLGNEAAVHLLGKWAEGIAGTQAGFDMADWNAMVKAGERSSERGGGVALDKNECGFFAADDWFETGHDARANFVGRLVGLHDLKVFIHLNAEEFEEWIEQGGVLAGTDYEGVKVGAGVESAENWGELDDLGAGAEDTQNPRPGSAGLAQRSAGLGIKRLRGLA